MNSVQSGNVTFRGVRPASRFLHGMPALFRCARPRHTKLKTPASGAQNCAAEVANSNIEADLSRPPADLPKVHELQGDTASQNGYLPPEEG